MQKITPFLIKDELRRTKEEAQPTPPVLQQSFAFIRIDA
jgi:hypothetical protein